MDEKYDVIILGTGLTECVMSGLMSVNGKKVLHMDRNAYYGGESTSLCPIEQVFSHFGHSSPEGPALEKYGRGRDWNVDLIPKFLMASGKLVKLLIHTGVTRYLEFKSIEGSYVLKGKKPEKVPSSEKEALTSGIVGLFEKRRLRNLLMYVNKFEKDNPKTWDKLNLDSTVEDLYNSTGVSENVQGVCGHALALYRSEDYKKLPMTDFIERCQLYSESLAKYGKSPYLYPMYGLGELPQGFARLSAIHGGTYMLDKLNPTIVFDNGVAVGVESDGQVAKCDIVICDPSYAQDYRQRPKTGSQVVRAICILKNPIPGTDGALSCQIIIPQNEVNRQNDIYVSMVSSTHNIAPKGFFIALVSTTVETGEPEKELQPGLNILGKIEDMFIKVYDIYEPKDNCPSNVFISKSYDATSHFETTCDDILDLYKRVTGEEFDFSKVRLGLDEEQ